MYEKIIEISDKINSENITTLEELKIFSDKYNKILSSLFEEFIKYDTTKKKEIGPLLNNLKNKIDNKYKEKHKELTQKNNITQKTIDYSLPTNIQPGNNHPLTNIENKIINIFTKLGFELVETPEIEDDWHNFTALNIPKFHPAREMQDTFFIDSSEDKLLRTHTTSSQIRILEKGILPIKCISIGRVYRNETISARSHCYFNQIDGFYVDKNVNILTLIHTFKSLFNELFGSKTKIRIRPSYFPFTSPSIEVDVECFLCNKTGCQICKNSGWLEVFGGGVIHENVLKNCKIDSKRYTGIAIGGGIERLSLLTHKIDDIRNFSTNDINFLKQFKFNIL